MSFTKPRSFSFAAIILFVIPVEADEQFLIDYPELHERLQEQGHPYPVGKPFANETLDCDFYKLATVDHVVKGQQGDPKIIFTSIRMTVDGYFLFPNMLIRGSAGNWIRTPIPMAGDGWMHIYQSKEGKRFLITMDNVQESAGWETRVVLSEDSGQTWRYGNSIRKYVYFDIIRYFRMSESGHGTAVEHYTGGVGGYDNIGFYVFETDDWGYTWSGPQFAVTHDTAAYVDVLELKMAQKRNRHQLSDLDLLNSNDCPVIE